MSGVLLFRNMKSWKCWRTYTFLTRVPYVLFLKPFPTFARTKLCALQQPQIILFVVSSAHKSLILLNLIMESLDEEPRTGNVDYLDLIPCMGLCCCFLSFYTELPDCLGTVCETTLLCINVRSLLCKTSKEENTYCKCCSQECDVVPCSVCIKVRIFEGYFQCLSDF